MNPVLYPSTETQFDTNGIGIMADAVSCKVSEELNGGYELVMQYPIDGIHYSEIHNRCILFCEANAGNGQPFRIYRITKPIKGIVTIYAAHISYDLSGIPVKPFTAGSAAGAITALGTEAAIDSPFVFWTDKTNAGNLTVATPLSSRSVLGEGDNSVISIYGGELEFDRYTVRLHNERGTDRGVSIRYGKNLTSLEQDENNSNVYTGVYPYYADGDGNLTQLDELIVPAPGIYDYEKILPLDLSGEFDNTPTKAQLKAMAEAYVQTNNIGIPEISLTLSFVQLDQTEEYKDKALLERVYLGDTVSVEFAALGVSATARCIKTTYDVLLERYESVELGDARASIESTIVGQQQTIKKIESQPVTTAVQNAINAATALITGNKGGYVILHSSTGNKQPDEILIMDTPDISSAVKVWRWNKSGLGYSSTGYNGPYGTAITQDGAIVANFITSGGMDAARITAGVLTSADGRVQFDLTAGTLYVKAADGTVKLGFDTAGNLTVRGTIYATNSEFSGKVTATSGYIGNFKIAEGRLETDDFKIYPTVTGLLQARGVGLYLYGNEIIGNSSGLHMYGNTHIHGGLQCDNGFEVTGLGGGDVNILDVKFDYSSGGEPTIQPTEEASSNNVGVGNIGLGNYFWNQMKANEFAKASSIRYKENVTDLTAADVGDIDNIRPVTYELKGKNDGKRRPGFIAEELAEVAPLFVNYDEDGSPESIDYSQITALLVYEVKKLRKRVSALEGDA